MCLWITIKRSSLFNIIVPKNKSYLNNRKNSTFSTRVYVWSDFSTTNLQWRIWIKFYDHRKSPQLKDKWSSPCKKAAETFDLYQQSTTTWGGLMANNFKYKHLLGWIWNNGNDCLPSDNCITQQGQILHTLRANSQILLPLGRFSKFCWIILLVWFRKHR